MICPYSFDEPYGSGIPVLLDGRYWCMGHIALGMSAQRRRCPEDCPVDMGEWGAWRSVLGEIYASWDNDVEMTEFLKKLNGGANSTTFWGNIGFLLYVAGWSL